MGRRYKDRQNVLAVITAEGNTVANVSSLLGKKDARVLLENLVVDGYLSKTSPSRVGRTSGCPAAIYKKTDKTLEIPAYLDKVGAAAKMRQYTKDNPDRVHNTQLKKNYGITHADYLELLRKQDGKCGICDKTKPGSKRKYWCVDHCHTTRRIRGLLCVRCNSGLGAFGDSTEGLSKALRYLQSDKCQAGMSSGLLF